MTNGPTILTYAAIRAIVCCTARAALIVVAAAGGDNHDNNNDNDSTEMFLGRPPDTITRIEPEA